MDHILLRMKKLILLTVLFLLPCVPVHAAQPMLGIAGIDSGTPRAASLARIFESHLGNIMRSSLVSPGGVFEQVSTGTLREELVRFNCLEDSCVARFAARAGIAVILRGSIEELTDSLELTVYALGMDAPYYGRTIYRYRAVIPTGGLRLGTREYSYIFEEHAARFIGGFLRRYEKPLFFRNGASGMALESPEPVSGVFTVHRPAPERGALAGLRRHYPLGVATLREGRIARPSPSFGGIREGDFILVNFAGRADALDDFYYGRKREIVLAESGATDTMSMALFTVPASLTMPFVAPVLGYYATKDYAGLGLWAVNTAPWLYLEYDGIRNRPQLAREERRDIPREVTARYRFSVYMLLCGNMSLFVDAFAHSYLHLASNYQGVQQYMGNSWTAAYLSLVSGGGGHFYRGNRFWGYAYFHANNALLYLTLREFSGDLTYDAATGSYREGDIDRNRAYVLLASYCALKAVEVVHAVLSRDRLQNGIVSDGGIDILPYVLVDEGRDFILGASASARF